MQGLPESPTETDFRGRFWKRLQHPTPLHTCLGRKTVDPPKSDEGPVHGYSGIDLLILITAGAFDLGGPGVEYHRRTGWED